MVGIVAVTTYETDTPSPTLSAGASAVFILCHASSGDGSTLTNCTLGGAGYVDIQGPAPNTGGEEAVLGVASFTHPGAGSYQIVSTFSGVGSVRSKMYTVIELSDADTAISGFVFSALGGQSNNFIASKDLASASGELAISFAVASDAATFEDNGGTDYAGNLTNVNAQVRDYLQACSGVDAVVASDPTTYQFQFSETSLSGGFYDRAMIAVFYVAGGGVSIPVVANHLRNQGFQ